MTFTPIILIHMLAAVGAIVLGAITLKLKKGTPRHRLFGRLWVALMLTAALVSFGIKASGQYSWIHLLSVLVLVSISAAVFAAMRGRIRAHQRGMTYSYAGLVIAGLFTFLPARRLGYLLWHSVGLV